MAGMPPFFLTGASAKIRLNGVTLAYCANLTYAVTVKHADPIVLGMYEPTSLEPLSYRVNGTLTVVRYANNVKSQLEGAGYKTPPGTSPDGNGVGNFTPNNGSSLISQVFSSGAFGNDGRAQQSFDPGKLAVGTFFDIEVYQKMPTGDNRGVVRLRSCRLTSMAGNLAKKTPLMEQFTFQAIYLDGDSFLASTSGLGQENE